MLPKKHKRERNGRTKAPLEHLPKHTPPPSLIPATIPPMPTSLPPPIAQPPANRPRYKNDARRTLPRSLRTRLNISQPTRRMHHRTSLRYHRLRLNSTLRKTPRRNTSARHRRKQSQRSNPLLNPRTLHAHQYPQYIPLLPSHR